MLLAIDCGNTNTVFSIWNGTGFVATWRIATDHKRTADEYFVWLSSLMALTKTEAAITEAIAALFDRLFVLKPDADEEGDARPWRVTLDDAARSAFVRFFTEHNEAQVELRGDDAAAWSKLEGYAPRLALVFHLIRQSADDPSAVDPLRVDVQSMEAAIRVTRWFAREALRVNAMLSESDTERTTRQLAEWIERKGGAVTVRDLTRGPREYRNDPARAEAALQALVAAGVGCWDTATGSAKGGRPADRFRLTPRGKAREC
jgi:hypothetical protein